VRLNPVTLRQPPPQARRAAAGRRRDRRRGQVVYELGPDGVTASDYLGMPAGNRPPAPASATPAVLVGQDAGGELLDLLDDAGSSWAAGAALNVPDSDPFDVVARALFESRCRRGRSGPTD
jgi:hypothetical protein